MPRSVRSATPRRSLSPPPLPPTSCRAHLRCRPPIPISKMRISYVYAAATRPTTAVYPTAPADHQYSFTRNQLPASGLLAHFSEKGVTQPSARAELEGALPSGARRRAGLQESGDFRFDQTSRPIPLSLHKPLVSRIGWIVLSCSGPNLPPEEREQRAIDQRLTMTHKVPGELEFLLGCPWCRISALHVFTDHVVIPNGIYGRCWWASIVCESKPSVQPTTWRKQSHLGW